MPRDLVQIANEWDVDILTLMKLARKNKIGTVPTAEEIDTLKSKLSGFYELSDREIRDIEDFISNDPKAKEILGRLVPLVGFAHDEKQEKQYVSLIAKVLFEAMGDSALKKKIKPETIYETVMNLGVIQQPRLSSSSEFEGNKVPPELLRLDPSIAKGIINSYFIKELEKVQIRSLDDFDKAREKVSETYEKMRGGQQ